MDLQDDADDDWFPEDIHEALKEMRNRKIFEVSAMYTIADAWGWTWEREIKKRVPRKWSQEWEVDLAVKIMQKVTLCFPSLFFSSQKFFSSWCAFVSLIFISVHCCLFSLILN